MLHAVDSDHSIVASDHEPGMRGDRLALMAVVRGLEALDQPSAVKLVTGSSYVRRGVTRGLAEWCRNGWKWERFGRLVAVRDEDLWRRVDMAMDYHRVSCRGWRPLADAAPAATQTSGSPRPTRTKPPHRLPPLSAAERVVEGVINEPALLIVRGRRRHVVATEWAEPAAKKLAHAG